MFGNPIYSEKISNEIAGINLPAHPENLYQPISYILGLAGKRIRPQLVLLGAELFGHQDLDQVLPAAVAVEYFHNFSLIHDDIMDKAPLRRGKKTVHQEWNDNIAILSGDALLVKSYEQIAKCPTQYVSELLKTFNKVALEVCEGQQYDMDFEERADVDQEEYINMIRLKTSVLLGGALELGAIIANASAINREKLYNFGVDLGIAFQLQDDILDAFGDPLTFGKQVGGDIIVNKKTILHILLRNSLDAEDLLTFNQILNLTENEADRKVAEMKNLYAKYEILLKASALKEKYTSSAYTLLAEIAVEEDSKASLYTLADTLMNRVR